MTSGIQLTPHLLNLPSPIERDTSKTPRTRPSLKNIRTKSGKNKVHFYWFLPVAGPSSFLTIWQRRSVFFFDNLTKKILTISLADCLCGSTPSGKKKLPSVRITKVSITYAEVIFLQDHQWRYPTLTFSYSFHFPQAVHHFSNEASFCFLPDSSSSLLNPHPFLILQRNNIQVINWSFFRW